MIAEALVCDARLLQRTGPPEPRARWQVWGVPTSAMQCEWLGERVATVDLRRAIGGVVTGREDAGWGPNAVFRFPMRGGTGGIWRGVSRLLPARRQARPQYGH
jgi:hypothetical protein